MGEEILCEVALDEQAAEQAARFLIHPALFDAALHGGFLGPAEAAARLPFAWRRVRLAATGATELRVRIAPAGEGAASIAAVDADGAPAGAGGAPGPRPRVSPA